MPRGLTEGKSSATTGTVSRRWSRAGGCCCCCCCHVVAQVEGESPDGAAGGGHGDSGGRIASSNARRLLGDCSLVREDAQHLVESLPLQNPVGLQLLLPDDLPRPPLLGRRSAEDLCGRGHQDSSTLARLGRLLYTFPRFCFLCLRNGFVRTAGGQVTLLALLPHSLLNLLLLILVRGPKHVGLPRSGRGGSVLLILRLVAVLLLELVPGPLQQAPGAGEAGLDGEAEALVRAGRGLGPGHGHGLGLGVGGGVVVERRHGGQRHAVPEQGLVAGEEGAEGEVLGLPRHEVRGGLPHHARLEQRRHLHGQRGTQRARAVPPRPLGPRHGLVRRSSGPLTYNETCNKLSSENFVNVVLT